MSQPTHRDSGSSEHGKDEDAPNDVTSAVNDASSAAFSLHDDTAATPTHADSTPQEAATSAESPACAPAEAIQHAESVLRSTRKQLRQLRRQNAQLQGELRRLLTHHEGSTKRSIYTSDQVHKEEDSVGEERTLLRGIETRGADEEGAVNDTSIGVVESISDAGRIMDAPAHMAHEANVHRASLPFCDAAKDSRFAPLCSSQSPLVDSLRTRRAIRTTCMYRQAAAMERVKLSLAQQWHSTIDDWFEREVVRHFFGGVRAQLQLLSRRLDVAQHRLTSRCRLRRAAADTRSLRETIADQSDTNSDEVAQPNCMTTAGGDHHHTSTSSPHCCTEEDDKESGESVAAATAKPPVLDSALVALQYYVAALFPGTADCSGAASSVVKNPPEAQDSVDRCEECKVVQVVDVPSVMPLTANEEGESDDGPHCEPLQGLPRSFAHSERAVFLCVPRSLGSVLHHWLHVVPEALDVQEVAERGAHPLSSALSASLDEVHTPAATHCGDRRCQQMPSQSSSCHPAQSAKCSPPPESEDGDAAHSAHSYTRTIIDACVRQRLSCPPRDDLEHGMDALLDELEFALTRCPDHITTREGRGFDALLDPPLRCMASWYRVCRSLHATGWLPPAATAAPSTDGRYDVGASASAVSETSLCDDSGEAGSSSSFTSTLICPLAAARFTSDAVFPSADALWPLFSSSKVWLSTSDSMTPQQTPQEVKHEYVREGGGEEQREENDIRTMRNEDVLLTPSSAFARHDELQSTLSVYESTRFVLCDAWSVAHYLAQVQPSAHAARCLNRVELLCQQRVQREGAQWEEMTRVTMARRLAFLPRHALHTLRACPVYTNVAPSLSSPPPLPASSAPWWLESARRLCSGSSPTSNEWKNEKRNGEEAGLTALSSPSQAGMSSEASRVSSPPSHVTSNTTSTTTSSVSVEANWQAAISMEAVVSLYQHCPLLYCVERAEQATVVTTSRDALYLLEGGAA